MYVIYDVKNKKAITEPRKAIELSKILKRLNETDKGRYELIHVDEFQNRSDMGKTR